MIKNYIINGFKEEPVALLLTMLGAMIMGFLTVLVTGNAFTQVAVVFSILAMLIAIVEKVNCSYLPLIMVISLVCINFTHYAAQFI